MKSLYNYILEADMTFDKKFELEFELSKSIHASERQSRHGEDKKNFISDDDILKEVKKASEQIIQDIIQNILNVGDRLIVKNEKNDLNIVCGLHRGSSKDKLKVSIITVMRAEDFHNPFNTYTITNKK